MPRGRGLIADYDRGSYLLEHGLKTDGRPNPDAKELGEAGSFETFFTETGSGKYVPRSIFVDLDPSVRCPACPFASDRIADSSFSPLTRSAREPIASSSTPNC